MSLHLCSIAEIGDSGKEVRVQGATAPVFLMLFLDKGTVRAYHNVCPHQGRCLNWTPDGFLFSPEGLLVCPHHGASFELDSGKCLAGPCVGAHLRPVQVTLKDDSVWLDQALD